MEAKHSHILAESVVLTDYWYRLSLLRNVDKQLWPYDLP
jgi:hypothetical protein